MSQLLSMIQYAQAFELAYLSDDWSVIEPFFAENAVHVVRNGGPHDRDDRGRDAVVSGFRSAVHEYDRRFDFRLPEILEGPIARADGVWMRFRLTMARDGLPDLAIEGDHLVRYEGDRIAAIEERVLGDGGKRTAEFLATHDAALRKPSNGPVPQASVEASAVSEALAKSVVRSYGAAKSQQDIDAALALCTDDFWIDTVSFGVRSRDRAETADHLALFFDAFPDYSVTVSGLITEEPHACLWGRARMTLAGGGLGIAPTGKTADVPIYCVFELRGGLLASERFFFDAADLCRQVGVGLEELQRTLDSVRSDAA